MPTSRDISFLWRRSADTIPDSIEYNVQTDKAFFIFVGYKFKNTSHGAQTSNTVKFLVAIHGIIEYEPRAVSISYPQPRSVLLLSLISSSVRRPAPAISRRTSTISAAIASSAASASTAGARVRSLLPRALLSHVLHAVRPLCCDPDGPTLR